MRDRVLLQLRRAADNHPPSNDLDRITRPLAETALANDRRHGWGLLHHPDRLRISTIDALCTRLANALPVLSGGGGLTPVERGAELHREAARRTLARLGEDPVLTASLRTLLLHRDNNLADTETLIAGMLGCRDQWANLIPLTGEQLSDHYLETVTLPRLEKALEHAICRALTRLDQIFPTDLCEQLSTLARNMSHSAGYQGAENPLAICRELALHPGTAAESLEHWKLLANLLVTKEGKWRSGFNKNHVAFEIEKHHKTELKSIVDRISLEPAVNDALCNLTKLPPLRYPEHQWLVAKALFRILSHALVELQFVFQSTGTCDFTELTLTALAALRAGTALDDLTTAAGARLDHLLIDEMQDTSATQYELIRLLTQSWDGYSQTAFLVGDPRQSIYLFRQAQVARFLDTLRTRRLGDLPLTPLHLTANFRSQSNLVHAFNQTFLAIFPAPGDETSRVLHPRGARVDSEASAGSTSQDSIPYRNAHPTRPPTAGLSLEWHPSTIPYEAPDKAAERHLQTQRSAAEIRRLIDRWRVLPLPAGRTAPWKIAILGRNRTHLHEVTKALEPDSYQAINIVPLGERQEVLDLLALTRALLHPADRTAWLALLRTPWCGLTLADLHTLAGQDAPENSQTTIFDLLRGRGALLTPDGIARLEPFWLVMQSALTQRALIPLSRLVARTARAFAADSFYDKSERANATRYLQMLEELESQPEPITVARLDRGLEDLYANPSTTDDQVQMMTIHGAKGLEWDFVVVPQMESGAGTDRGKLLAWLDLEDPSADDSVAYGIIAPVQARGDDTHPLNRWMNSIRTAREKAEVKRLFYVAATRAREELHLFAAPKLKQNGEPELRSKTLLEAAWPAAELAFNQPEPAILPALAATDLILVPPPAPRTMGRIPLSSFPAATIPGTPHLDSEMWEVRPYTRPEGSLEARILGNVTHTFLELLAQRAASGPSFPSLLAETKTWSPRIQTILRSAGLAQESIPAARATILHSLTRMLEDPNGRWLLTPHPEASTESSLSAPSETIRLDRTFLAGSEPLTTGTTHLWIVDYKTGFRAAEGRESFLAKQRELYAPQLETYAPHLASRGLPIRLALYFPTLPALLWWPHRLT